jgi:surface antigen
MAYSGYGSRVSSCKQNIDSLSSAINAIDIESSWSGGAATKQCSNLETVLTGLKEQSSYMEALASALALIDDYDSNKRSEESYQRTINSLDSSSSSYQRDVNYYSSMRNSARDTKNQLKQQINELLNSISNRYNETLSDIAATEVVSTVNTFKDVDTIASTIGDAFDMSKTVVTAKSLNEKNMYPNFDNKDAWVTQNPYSMVGLYGQCTWFAWGRFYEIYGYSPGFTGNGNQCARQLLNAHGDKFYESTTPVPGAVFSQGLGEKYGHVGIVLAVDEANDTITIQDGNYNGSTDSFAVAQSDWGTRTMSLSEFCAKRGGAIFACPKEGA